MNITAFLFINALQKFVVLMVKDYTNSSMIVLPLMEMQFPESWLHKIYALTQVSWKNSLIVSSAFHVTS